MRIELQNTFPNQYDIAINTNERTLKQVIAGLLTLEDAIELGKIKVTGGDVDDLKKFVNVFDTGLKGYPVDSKALDIGKPNQSIIFYFLVGFNKKI